MLGWPFGVSGGRLGVILGHRGSQECFCGGLDTHLGVFQGPLGHTFGGLERLGSHFGDSLMAFVGNMGSCKMY